MQTESGFYGLGIAPKLMEAVKRAKFAVPTPIQRKSIPVAIEGKDIIGIAQTGTGKTLAFGVPMLQRLAQVKGRGLVVLPTRELALQVDEMLHKIGRSLGLRTAVLIGGASMVNQKKMLRRTPHILIATPGRLIDHLEQKNVNLHDIRVLVLDEADRMLDMGFAPQLQRILKAIPRERQTMLFSATMPDKIVAIARSYMKLPVRVEVAPSGTVAERVTHELFVVKREDKINLLTKLLETYRGQVLVFSRTKFGIRRIVQALRAAGLSAGELHSNRSLAQRREALDGFKSGKYRVLVATDIAARGIDVVGIELVVNYDIPENPEDYIHRVGRTGRAGETGHAISFATADQGADVRAIEKLVRVNFPISKLPGLPPPRLEPRHEPRANRRYSRPPRRGGLYRTRHRHSR